MIHVRATVAAVTAAATVAALAAGCGPHNTGSTVPTPASTHAAPPTPSGLLPPDVNSGVQVSGAVSGLGPATPIMVGEGPTSTVCLTGFYVDFPDSSHPGAHVPAFLTAAQCAAGNAHATVAVMKAGDPGHSATRTQVGAITYLSPGDENPVAANAPWTIPISPLAVFAAEQPNWPLPIELTVNGKPPASTLAQSVQPAEQGTAPVTWTNSFGEIVTGHVLDPAATPDIRNIPGNLERVVVSADDPSKSLHPEVLGSPVTVELDGATSNLGVVVGIDTTRHWLVVDLVDSFLTAHGAHLIVAR